jgi:hypothetical protein
MSTAASQSPVPLQIARRLLTREGAQVSDGGREMAVAALERTCLRVCDNLRDAMGDDGCHALLLRALARAEVNHPALADLCRVNGGGIHLDGVLANVEAHGVPAVTAATEALLAALVEILGRLIGEDMAIRLIDHDAARPPSNNGVKAP